MKKINKKILKNRLNLEGESYGNYSNGNWICWLSYGVALSHIGHKVTCIDIDEKKWKV